MRALRSMTNLLGSQDYDNEETYEDLADAPVPDYGQQYPDDYVTGQDLQEGQDGVAVDLHRIVTVHPTTYNEAHGIGEAFREGLPVIINLTGMSESEARRMVDFSAGLIFGLHGSIERVTPRVFLLTPATVTIDSSESGGSNDLFHQG